MKPPLTDIWPALGLGCQRGHTLLKLQATCTRSGRVSDDAGVRVHAHAQLPAAGKTEPHVCESVSSGLWAAWRKLPWGVPAL